MSPTGPQAGVTEEVDVREAATAGPTATIRGPGSPRHTAPSLAVVVLYASSTIGSVTGTSPPRFC